MKKQKNYKIVGWREWCELPDLGLPAIKAKVDTGAATSALHAFNIREFSKFGRRYVRFEVHPIQKNNIIVRECVAELVDKRHVKSSSGHKNERYVIVTPLRIGEDVWPVEITLTSRDMMAYRMLVGRQALRQKKILVNSFRSFLYGRLDNKEATQFYKA